MKVKDIVNRCNNALFLMRPFKNSTEEVKKILDTWHRKGYGRIPINPRKVCHFSELTETYKVPTSLYFEDYLLVVDKEVAKVLERLGYADEVPYKVTGMKHVNSAPVWISLTEEGKKETSSVSSHHWIFDGRLNRKKGRTCPRPYYRWLRSLSKGSTVACCYDGKWGRAVKGTVVKRNSSNIWVKFIPWAVEEKTEVVVKFTEGEGYNTGSSQMGLMYSLGCKGDFYRLSPLEGNPTPKNMYYVPLTFLIESRSVKMARELKEAMENGDVDY
jgi:hypothetical protein